MKEVKITTITARADGADRYSYNRESSLKISEEHFDKQDTQSLVATFIALAVAKGLLFETSVSTVEIPADEEESFKAKYEQAQKTISTGYSERAKVTKENEALKAQVEALLKACPDSHVVKDETTEDEEVED